MGAAVSYPITSGMSLGLRYEGMLAGSNNAHGAMDRLAWEF